MPGVATSPIDVVFSNASWPVSSNSGVLRQDVTPVNPLGGVDGFVKASACGEEKTLAAAEL